jgi:hypothetical protein
MHRLERLESLTATSEERIKIEHYDLSPAGDLILRPDASGDGRPATKTIQVILVDSDGNGGPGPRYSAYQRRHGPPKAVAAEAKYQPYQKG